MYICLCNAVTESQVMDAIHAGASTVDALRKQLKVSNCCGSCEPTIVECLGKSLQSQAPEAPRHKQTTL